MSDVALARGPGNLGRVFGWTLADNRRPIVAEAAPDALVLVPGEPVEVVSGPRVGVSVGHQRPWRFWAAGDLTVSAYRRSPRIVAGRLDW